ncbi:MAG: hypothetical protein OXC71_05175 [Chloroflexi bacterium]|nr:hypothetical protein [Chloroflexota bacterium]
MRLLSGLREERPNTDDYVLKSAAALCGDLRASRCAPGERGARNP